MWARIGPAAGIAGWVIALIGYSIHGYPAMGASGDQLTRWALATDPYRFALGINVEAVGIVIIVLFYAWLCDLIRRSPAPAWLPLFAFALVVVWGAGAIFGNSVWTALLEIGRHSSGPHVLLGMRDVAHALLNASYLFFGLGMVVIGGAAYLGKALPVWLAWPAVVIGVGLALPAAENSAGLLVIVWAFAVGVLHVARRSA